MNELEAEKQQQQQTRLDPHGTYQLYSLQAIMIIIILIDLFAEDYEHYKQA